MQFGDLCHGLYLVGLFGRYRKEYLMRVFSENRLCGSGKGGAIEKKI